MKVKLGPIALVYNGSGTFVEKDEAAHRFVVDAKGKDKRGNGTAGAKVTLSMAPSASGGTDVEVLTDLAVTGKPAQFGRGVMQDVSDKLLGQFVACLEQRLGPAAAAAQPDAAAGVGRRRPERQGPSAAPSRHADPAVPRLSRRGRRAAAGTCAAVRGRRRLRRPRTVARPGRTTPSTSARPCCRSCSRPTGSRASGRWSSSR